MEKNFNLNQNVGMVMNGGEHVQIEGWLSSTTASILCFRLMIRNLIRFPVSVRWASCSR